MRTRRITLATLALALATTIGVAGPANADHVADLFPERGECRMGGYVTGAYVDFWTTDIPRMTVKDGEITGFTCKFKGLPEEFHFPGDPEPVWTRSTKAVVMTGFVCWREPNGILSETTNSRFVMTPSGNGVLTCTF